jgi:hypothetical protein
VGQELSHKPFSLLSVNPRFLRPVALKYDLPAMKDNPQSIGTLLTGRIILIEFSDRKYKSTAKC